MKDHQNYLVCWRLAGRLFAAAAVSAAALASPFAGAATPYPDQSLRIIVPYGPGGTGDVIARLVAKKLGDDLGQPVIVENKGGAAGSIGTMAAARAAPDGYTILLAYTSEMVINPFVQKGVNYDVARDFAPVALAGSTPLLLVANPGLGVKSIKDLVRLAKASPDRVSYASAGPGSPAHIAGALLTKEAGIQMAHIPYKGGSQAVADTVGGVVDVYFSGMPPAIPFVKSGKLVALGVAAKQPSPALPDVPALAASGYARLDLSGWFGFFVPKNVSPDIRALLHEKIAAALQSEDIKTKLAMQGVETDAMSSAQFQSFVEAEQAKYKQLIQELGIGAE